MNADFYDLRSSLLLFMTEKTVKIDWAKSFGLISKISDDKLSDADKCLNIF